MKKKWIGRALLFAPLAVLFLAGFSYAVMRLWNWLVPPVFGWHVINFWQAVGLLVLCKILFGGFRGGPRRRMYWRHRMRERWEQMTPEERDKFRQGLQGRCGSFGRAAETPKA